MRPGVENERARATSVGEWSALSTFVSAMRGFVGNGFHRAETYRFDFTQSSERGKRPTEISPFPIGLEEPPDQPLQPSAQELLGRQVDEQAIRRHDKDLREFEIAEDRVGVA